MKKLFVTLSVLVTVLLCAFLLSSCESNADEEITLYVYNWGEYIDQDVLDEIDSGRKYRESIQEQWLKNEFAIDTNVKIEDNEKKTEFILYLQKLSALQKAQEDMRAHPLEVPA